MSPGDQRQSIVLFRKHNATTTHLDRNTLSNASELAPWKLFALGPVGPLARKFYMQ